MTAEMVNGFGKLTMVSIMYSFTMCGVFTHGFFKSIYVIKSDLNTDSDISSNISNYGWLVIFYS